MDIEELRKILGIVNNPKKITFKDPESSLGHYHSFLATTILANRTEQDTRFLNALDCLIHKTKIFQISKEIKELLLNTNNQSFGRKLPFDMFFLDVGIFHNNRNVSGIWIGNNFQTESTWDFPKGECLIRTFVFDMDLNRWESVTIPIFGDITKFLSERKEFSKTSSPEYNPKRYLQLLKIIQLFVCNFLDFLNNPEIETVIVERTKEQNTKRIKRGKLPFPPIHNIRVTGKLKVYLNQLQAGGHFNYSHRFWVRGHFRTLRNEERYKDKSGTKIWIVPYIKGQGILLNKQYEVKANSSQH